LSTVHGCTITSQRYAAHARVLADSFLQTHPGAPFSVLTLDGVPDALRGAERVEFLDLADVGIDELEANRLGTMYPLFAFANSLKPNLLSALLARAGGPVVYVDADGCLYDDLSPVAGLAEHHSLVLSPHLLDPDPVWQPDENLEETIIANGVYNAGLIGVGRGAEPFLRWWAQRTARRWTFDSYSGHGVDQSLLTLGATLFDYTVLADRGCNVAAWNLQRRDVEWEGDRPTIEAGPLRHFHFAFGFDPSNPEQLAPRSERPQPPWFPRLEERPGVARLAREYAQRLLECGYRDARAAPVRFAQTPGGVPLESWMRALYRVAIAQAERDRTDEPPNPFTDGDERFLEWVRSPQPPGIASRLPLREELLTRIDELERIRDDAVAWAEREGASRGAFERLAADRLRVAQAATAQREQAMGELERMRRSTSWRMTAPLRGVKAAGRAWRGRRAAPRQTPLG
jgi:hypothetical protein